MYLILLTCVCVCVCAQTNAEQSTNPPWQVTWQLRIVFLVLLVGILPNSCDGAHTNVNPHFRYNVDPAAILAFLPLPTLQLGPTALPSPTPPQRSRHNPEQSSVARFTRVSNCPRKVIAPTAHMGLSGSGTFQV